MHNETLTMPEPILDQADFEVPEPALYEYERADGTIERANSPEEAIEVCPVLGKLAMESPDVAKMLLDLAAVGREKMAAPEPESAPESQAEPELKVEADPKPKAEFFKKPEPAASEPEPKVEPVPKFEPIDAPLVEQATPELVHRVFEERIHVDLQTKRAEMAIEVPKAEIPLPIQAAPVVETIDRIVMHEREVPSEPTPAIIPETPKTIAKEVRQQISETPRVAPVPIARIVHHEPQKVFSVEYVGQVSAPEIPVIEQAPESYVVPVAELDNFTTITTAEPTITSTEPMLAFEENAMPERYDAPTVMRIFEELLAPEPATHTELADDFENPAPRQPSQAEAIAAISEEVVTPEILFEQASQQPLDQTFVVLERYLSREPIVAPEHFDEKHQELTTALQDIAALLPELKHIEEGEVTIFEEGQELVLTPEIVQKMLVLLDVLGYDQPEEVLVAFVEGHGITRLMQTLQQVSQPANVHDSKEFLSAAAASLISDDIAEPRSVLGNLVLKLFSAKAFVAAN